MAKLPPGITEWTPHPQTGKPRYLVRWRDPKGKAHKKVEDRLTDARNLLTTKQADVRRGTYVDDRAGRELFVDYAERWAESRDWKPATREQWAVTLRRMTWALGDGARLCDVDQLAYAAAKAKLSRRYAAETVAGTMHKMGAVLRSAVASGRLGRDPTIGVQAAPKRRQDDRGGVTPEMVPSRAEALAILAGAAAGWRASMALGLAGLRIGEMLGLRADRVELDRRKVTVDRQAVELSGQPVTLGTIKNDRPRTITVSPLVAVELRRHLRDGHGGTWTDADGVEHRMLFRRPDGKLWRQTEFYRAAFVPTLRTAELEDRFTFHALRHFCASSLLAEGASLPIVAGYLGDHQQTILRVYSHWLPDDDDVPADILDRVLAPEANAPSPRHRSGTEGR